MSRNTASCLVGVIAIETLPSERCQSTETQDAHDATLAGYLAYLSSGEATSDVATGASRALPAAACARLERRNDTRWGCTAVVARPVPARLSADLSGLAAQLDVAWRQTRRRIRRARLHRGASD